MFLRLILISTIFSFVYIRSIESRELQPLPILHVKLRSHTDMDTEPSKTMEQKLTPEYSSQENLHVLHVAATSENENTTIRPSQIPAVDHDSTHLGMKHPKKRATNYKEDRQIDIRPGCCG
ncbi:PREDICTED: uncharacterized protein LOC107188590 [Dufourea novaeangliae]|uniref:uncharacterized protein LOC107188590 n=1 Tax=Dufourea novaeangliae TaxID=178035 RepID=UPI000767C560|nr:PREDICTED: uncharacterized protein LOC107188590 [Dufourea novaeangliae]